MNELWRELPGNEWPRDNERAVRYQGWLEQVPYSVVPWCAEHDETMTKHGCWLGSINESDCRLEEPARHIVIGGSHESA